MGRLRSAGGRRGPAVITAGCCVRATRSGRSRVRPIRRSGAGARGLRGGNRLWRARSCSRGLPVRVSASGVQEELVGRGASNACGSGEFNNALVERAVNPNDTRTVLSGHELPAAAVRHRDKEAWSRLSLGPRASSRQASAMNGSVRRGSVAARRVCHQETDRSYGVPARCSLGRGLSAGRRRIHLGSSPFGDGHEVADVADGTAAVQPDHAFIGARVHVDQRHDPEPLVRRNVVLQHQ